MKTNTLTKVKQTISSKLSDEEITRQVNTVLKELDTIYSYLIRAKYSENRLTEWTIEYLIADEDRYNTLQYKDIVHKLILSILTSRLDKKYIVGYKQPELEIMMQLFTPLVHKLAYLQANKWNELEYEDAISMCWLVMTMLYRKGYYVNKALLAKSFNNYVLMHLRSVKNKPEMISLEQILYNNDVDNALTAEDMLPDLDDLMRRENEENMEVIKVIFEEVKDTIIVMIGPRQFDQLFRDYANKHTTSWSRKKMQDLKTKFSRLGITWRQYEKYYE